VTTDGGPWRGPTLEQWLERIAKPILHPGETLPLVKPVEQPEGATHGDDDLVLHPLR
jgi:hypothetical protein